jgi:hypothetical protein
MRVGTLDGRKSRISCAALIVVENRADDPAAAAGIT